MSKAFDLKGVLYLVPFALLHLALLWSPGWFDGDWPYTSYFAIASLLLLPWLKARVYPDESIGKIVLFEVPVIASVALLEFLFRDVGGTTVDRITLVIAAIALTWFVVHERRKNVRQAGR